MGDPITRAAESLWVVVPLRLQRRYAVLRGVVGDWHGMALVPSLAVLSITVVATAFGVVGAFGMGYEDLFTESLWILATMIALGAFSGQLGLVGLASYAIGDFFFSGRTWTAQFQQYSLVEEVIRSRLPLIITYLLFAVAVLMIPRLGKNLALGIGQWRRIPTDLAWLVSTPITVLVSWLGLRTWAAMAPTLLRPYFGWRGNGSPSLAAVEVLQVQTSSLVAAGVAATVLRQFVMALSIYLPSIRARVAAMEARAFYKIGDGAANDIGSPAPLSNALRLRADVISALVASLVLSGILETRTLWLICFLAFLTVRLLRSGSVRFRRLEQWKTRAGKVPVVARMGLTWLGAAACRSMLSNDAIGSYRTMALLVLAGVVISFLIFPGTPEPVEESPGPIAAAGPAGVTEGTSA